MFQSVQKASIVAYLLGLQLAVQAFQHEHYGHTRHLVRDGTSTSFTGFDPFHSVCSTAEEGSCRDSNNGHIERCGSGMWQPFPLGDTWSCVDGTLTLRQHALPSHGTNISQPSSPDSSASTSVCSSCTSQSESTSKSEPTSQGESMSQGEPTPQSEQEAQATTSSSSSTQSGKVSMINYPNWNIYARKFPPEAITNPLRFSHILYAFANVASNGTVYLSDTNADLNQPGQDPSIKGCIERLRRLKKISPALKILLSIGGWTYSSNFATPLSTEVGQKAFANSAIKVATDYGLDGLDIDWEYPADETEGENLLALLREIKALNRSLILTAAVSADPGKIKLLPV